MVHDTLSRLQLPTMSLIGAFYQMSPEIKMAFADMMALYIHEPTPERANMLFDKVMGPETPDEKKEWLSQQARRIPPETRKNAMEKYVQAKQPVPKGLPTSGNFLVGLGIVSRADKDALMDAQAAARMLDHLENPNHVNLSQELFAKDASGQTTEARSYLDKPFSTPIQRLEHLSAIIAGYRVVQAPYQKVAGASDGLTAVPNLAPVSEALHKAAVHTLYQASEKLSPASKPVAEQIRHLAEAYAPQEDVKDWSFKDIAAGMKEILPCLFTWHAPHLNKTKVNLCEDSYSPAERDLVQKMVQKRITQIQSGLSPVQTKSRGAEK